MQNMSIWAYKISEVPLSTTVVYKGHMLSFVSLQGETRVLMGENDIILSSMTEEENNMSTNVAVGGQGRMAVSQKQVQEC